MRLRVRTDFLDDGFLKPNYLKEIVTTNDCWGEIKNSLVQMYE
jgi:hypothetical protein